MPPNAPETPGETRPGEPSVFGPGPWCFGADGLCEWLRGIPFIGGRSQAFCRVAMNILCLLVGLTLLIVITAVLLAAFLQPG